MNTIFFKNHKKKSVKSVIQTPSYGIIIKVISNNVNYERINNKHNLNEHAFDKEVSNEISIQNKCAEHNIAPPILLSKKTGPHEYKIIMRKMQFTLHDYLKKFKGEERDPKLLATLTKLVDKMHGLGVYHSDLHQGNIMVNVKPGTSIINMMRIIDFGNSIDFKKGFAYQNNLGSEFVKDYLLPNNEGSFTHYNTIQGKGQLRNGIRNNWKNIKLVNKLLTDERIAIKATSKRTYSTSNNASKATSKKNSLPSPSKKARMVNTTASS